MENQLYLTTDKMPDGRPGLLAVISKGSPQLGDLNVEVLDLEIVASQEEADSWFKQMIVERPWEREIEGDNI
jgi:hypothetical protein